MSISENIKRLRESRDLTQAELGKIAGVSDKAVSTWENGSAEPRMGAIQKMADYFHISKAEIIDDSPSSITTADESELLMLYRKLNNDGQHELIKHARLLCGSDIYIEECDNVSKEA